MLKSGVQGSNLLKCSRDQIGIKRAKVRCAPRRPLKVIAPRIKLAKVRCAPHRSQKGHRSAGGANVLKLVGRGARTKTAKVLRTPYVKDSPVANREARPDNRVSNNCWYQKSWVSTSGSGARYQTPRDISKNCLVSYRYEGTIGIFAMILTRYCSDSCGTCVS